jgi:CHAT domain-containing protein
MVQRKTAAVSAPDLTRFFYQSMLQGQDAATSLRTAQLPLLEEGIFICPFYEGHL